MLFRPCFWSCGVPYLLFSPRFPVIAYRNSVRTSAISRYLPCLPAPEPGLLSITRLVITTLVSCLLASFTFVFDCQLYSLALTAISYSVVQHNPSFTVVTRYGHRHCPASLTHTQSWPRPFHASDNPVIPTCQISSSTPYHSLNNLEPSLPSLSTRHNPIPSLTSRQRLHHLKPS